MVPLKYNIRSIRARKIGSLMTILGVGMVVWACVFAFGLSEGLDRTLKIAAGSRAAFPDEGSSRSGHGRT